MREFFMNNDELRLMGRLVIKEGRRCYHSNTDDIKKVEPMANNLMLCSNLYVKFGGDMAQFWADVKHRPTKT